MPTYIALLRGINVSGQKKIKMTELRQLLNEIGLEEVRTYIQSGNVIFFSPNEKKELLRRNMKDVIKENFGFEVGIWLEYREKLLEILNQCPFIPHNEEEGKQLYFVFMNSRPAKALKDKLELLQFENEEFIILDDCVYLNCKKGYGKAKCNNNFFESRLKVEATTRNYRTVMKLLELSG